MTVCAAIRNGTKTLLATDSRVSQGDTFRDENRDKFLRLPDERTVIAICGEIRIEQIIERMLNEPEYLHLLTINDVNCVYQLGDAILERIRLVYKNDELHTMRDTQLLIVSELCEAIFVMDHDFTVSEYLNYAAIGSGSDVCETALLTACRFGKRPRNALKVAMSVTCAKVANCGGDIHTCDVKHV